MKTLLVIAFMSLLLNACASKIDRAENDCGNEADKLVETAQITDLQWNQYYGNCVYLKQRGN